jgi:hypothetical protein
MNMSRAFVLVLLTIPSIAASGAEDQLLTGSGSVYSGQTARIPIYVRDFSSTRLGADRAAGQKIQALGFRLRYSPSNALSNVTFVRAGALLKTPLYEKTVYGNGSVGFVASFAESTQPLPLPLNSNGSLIGYLIATVAGAAGTGVEFEFDPAAAVLSNQAGTITETFANGGLTFHNGFLVVKSGSCPSSSVAISVTGRAGACVAGSGGTAQSSVSGTSGPHQWGYRTVSGGPVTPIPGATESEYVIRGADFDGPGTRYLVDQVTPLCGSQVTSNEVPITIADTSPVVSMLASTHAFANATENYASVPDQGVGATYQWSITNGTITSGQGTRAIRFTAGASGVVSLGVSVSLSGCGTPGTAAADVTIMARSTGATMFYMITPCRVIDTRNPVGPYGGPAAPPTGTRDIQMTGVCGIPAGAKSVAANITAVSPSATGFLAAYPTGLGYPGTASVNYRTGKTRASNSILTLSANGQVTMRNEGPQLHYIIDVTGYFH